MLPELAKSKFLFENRPVEQVIRFPRLPAGEVDIEKKNYQFIYVNETLRNTLSKTFKGREY